MESASRQVAYTTMLWNRPPSRLQSKVTIFVLFMIAGMFERYLEAVVLTLQHRGASYRDQAVFSVCNYPLFVKVLIAPLLDMHHVPAVGKCKTYLIFFSLVLSSVALAYSPFVDSHLLPANVAQVTAVFTLMSLAETLYVVAGEMLIAKIFDSDEEKGVGSIIYDVSVAVGGAVSYNMFLPLNSRNLMSHSTMLRVFAAVCCCFSLYLFLFFGEKHVAGAQMTYTKLFTLAKSAVTKRYPRLLLITILLLKAPNALVKESMNVKLVDLGMDRSIISAVDSYTLVIYLLAGWGLSYLMFERRMLRIGSLITIYFAFVGGLKVWMLFDLHSRRDLDRTFLIYMLQSSLERFNFSTSFITGYITVSAPQDICGTFLTFYFVLYNLGEKLPTTFGYLIINANYLDYFVYGALVFLTNFIAAASIYPYAKALDQLPNESFTIEHHTDYEYQALEVKVP